MDSDPKDEDVTTEHVLDYYKKYSQNRDLPKYFSGTSVSYLPEIKDTVSREPQTETTIKTNISIIVTNAEEHENVEPTATSRVNSPMSNHKLEWDSGADIGYGNCQEKRLRKSLSLPSIADLIQKKNDNDFKPVAADARSQTSSEGNVKVVLVTCSGSSSEYHSDENECKIISSSSSSANVEPQINAASSSSSSAQAPNNSNIAISSSSSSDKRSLRQFVSTLSYLKQKIGLPGAHSTPRLPDGRQSVTDDMSGTPVLKRSSNINEKDTENASKQVSSKSVVKKLSKESSVVVPTVAKDIDIGEIREFGGSDSKNVITKYQKIVNLAVTKPITVECTSSDQNFVSKSLQTVTKQSTIGVQTDEVTEKELQQIIRKSQTICNNQSLIYFEYSDDDKNSARSTQTDSDIIESNCDSFEYVVKQPSVIEDKVSDSNGVTSVQEHTTNLKRSQKSQDLRSNESKENSEKSSSKEFCLGNLVSSGLLDNVEDDIGKRVYLLQRLLKSKKYDPATKKRYIKKIIKKITESKYLEESSASSELFVPKKLPKSTSMTDANKNDPLQSNIPWYPTGDQSKQSTRREKLVQKTFTQDFIPAQPSSKEEISSAPEIVPINSRDTRNRFTLTNNEFFVNHKYESTEENKSAKTFSETDSTSLEKHYQSSSTSKSYQNWKVDKTLSEKLLEKQSDETSPSSNGNGDCFVKLADKEREFQISWINNEISHLGKLKGLLEKPRSAEQHPLNAKKTTNVYTVFNQNDTPSKPKRNYVIETVIGAKSSSEMNFKLDGQAYTVQEYLNSKRRREPKRPRQVTGNIEIVTSDSVTNIKVTTFCEKCKRTPCVCQFEEDDTACGCIGKCGSQTCLCLEGASARLSSDKETASRDWGDKQLASTACQICKNCPCVCGKESNNDVLTIEPMASSGHVKFSTLPSTSKEERRSRQNYVPDVTHRTTSTIAKSVQGNEDNSTSRICTAARRNVSVSPTSVVYCFNSQKDEQTSYGSLRKVFDSQKDEQVSYGSLRKVFENCTCTSTNCTCNFVEKLVNRFSKTEIPCSTACDNKCMQTDATEIQSVGLQTHIDTRTRNQQTTTFTIDDKCMQTEKFVSVSESETVGMQTWVKSRSETQQAGVAVVDAHTHFSKLEENFNNIGIQTRADVKDQILQTSRSLDEHDSLKMSVGTHMSMKGINQTKGVSFVDETTSPILRSAHTSPVHTKRQDATTSPRLQSDSTSSDTKRKSSPQRRSFASTSVDQVVVASQTSTSKLIHSRSGSSLSVSSKTSSSTSDRQPKKVICVCCCTQTEPPDKSRGRNVKVQIDSHSDKENVKRRRDSLTTSSATYEICPSILVSSCNETSRSISDESPSKLVICVCCIEKYPSDKISVLGSKDENYPICCNCLAKRPILTSVCYAGPEEDCPCSKPSSYKTDLSDEMTKRTLTDTNDVEEYCTCTKPFQFKNSKYCSHCQFKLRNTAKSKNGIAYTLTLESECLNKIRRRRKKIPLEEIRLKVPSPSKKKKHKDKENVSKRDKEGEREGKCGCGRIVCTSNCHVHGVSSKHRREKNGLTLQQYLQKNRPDFIHSAESRRHVVLNSKTDRVFHHPDAKLKFAEENMEKRTLKRPRKLFTEQEMKEITKRNYKKLPEVQQKINNKKEERLRSADRFIVDVFARKIQRSVLKGRSTFPIDTNVICLPKTCNC